MSAIVFENLAVWHPSLHPEAQVLILHNGTNAREIITPCLGRIGVRKVTTVDMTAQSELPTDYSCVDVIIIDMGAGPSARAKMLASTRLVKRSTTILVTTADNRWSTLRPILNTSVNSIILKPFSFRTFSERFSFAYKQRAQASVVQNPQAGIEIVTDDGHAVPAAP